MGALSIGVGEIDAILLSPVGCAKRRAVPNGLGSVIDVPVPASVWMNGWVSGKRGFMIDVSNEIWWGTCSLNWLLGQLRGHETRDGGVCYDEAGCRLRCEAIDLSEQG